MTRALPESRNSDLRPYRSQPSRRSFVEDLRQTFEQLWREESFKEGGVEYREAGKTECFNDGCSLATSASDRTLWGEPKLH